MLNDDILSDYLNECEEKLDKLNLQLTQLEKGEFNQDILRSIARDVHTIKGSSQLFGFSQIGQLTHAMEECMGRMSQASSAILPALIDRLYESLDMISHLFKAVKLTKQEPAPSEKTKTIIQKLESLSVSDANAITQEISVPLSPQKNLIAGLDESQADTIRVHVDLLDNLMNLVGELVLVRNQLGQITREIDHENLARVNQRLNVITGELQNDVMKTRMQTIGNVLNKFQRIARDMAKDLGKRVNIELGGTETELDKTLIEAIRDPLTHIVRNAIDHGIETPDERRLAGKVETGTLAIRAFHESGQVVIEIKDDGKGLSRERIAAKAIEKGIASAEAIGRLTDREIFQFIFLAGFSTAEKVSNLSGRGVGMDVVKTNIERIGGAVDLASVPTQGTTLTLKIPLTLAIIPALIVHTAGDKFAIPQVKLVELLRVEADSSLGHGIELLQGRPVFRLRGNLLPLVSLAEVLQLKSPNNNADRKATHAQALNIAVLTIDQHTFGLLIDAIDDSADIVVKPLANFIKDIGAYSGATILGDGSIALTLDIAGIASLSRLHIDTSQTTSDERVPVSKSPLNARSHTDENTEYLVIEIDSRGRYALPLCLVHRLEEFRTSDVHLSGDQPVVRYRNTLLPIISVKSALHLEDNRDTNAQEASNFPVVVVSKGDRQFGLQVKAIVDVILSAAKIDMHVRSHKGIIGTLIEGTDVITMIDALGLIDSEIARFSPQAAHDLKQTHDTSERMKLARQKFRILLAEDSAFFRRYVSQTLLDAGYQVQAECDASLALSTLEAMPKNTFSAIISDIEMPQMTGLEFVQRVRANSAWSKLPMMAMTTRFSNSDIQLGLALGFSRYLEKLNPHELLVELDQALGLKEGLQNAG